jgi:lipopolysaccharide biosynthesis glycosyltransferase
MTGSQDQMNNAIVTVQIGDGGYDYSKSLITINDYATRNGCDFVCRHYRKNTTYTPHIEKIYLINDMLSIYDRVLYLDLDIIIKKTAPNVFDLYNDINKLYMFNEFELGPKDCSLAMNSIVNTKGDISVDMNSFCYYNAGFMLCSQKHKNVFTPDASYFHVHGRYEQDFINYKIKKCNINVTNIDVRFNTMIGYDINNITLRDQSYFIHVTPMNKEIIRSIYDKYYLGL